MTLGSHTFVVVVYKDSPYLEACILSLLSQTVPSVIILSTSTPSSFLRALAKKYTLALRTHSERGMGADWSYAYSLATTEYVTLAHQDDIYSPTYTESCLGEAAKHPHSLFVYTKYAELRKDEYRGKMNLIVKELLTGFFIRNGVARTLFQKKGLLSLGSPILCPSVMYHKSRLGDFSFRKDMVVSLDWEAWWRIAHYDGEFVYVSDTLVQHRIHPAMETVNRIGDQKRRIEDEMMFSKIWPFPINRLLSLLYRLGYASNLSE